MPGHREHCINTARRLRPIFNGKSYNFIHKIVDNPYMNPYLRRRHRILFHDNVTPFMLATILTSGNNRSLKMNDKDQSLGILLAIISHYIDDYSSGVKSSALSSNNSKDKGGDRYGQRYY